MNKSPKDYLTDKKEELMEKIKDIAERLVEGRGYGFDDEVNKLLSLLTSEMEKERKRLLEVIGDNEIPYFKKVSVNTATLNTIRNDLRVEQSRKLKEIIKK